jgi:hypothetical protein
VQRRRDVTPLPVFGGRARTEALTLQRQAENLRKSRDDSQVMGAMVGARAT